MASKKKKKAPAKSAKKRSGSSGSGGGPGGPPGLNDRCNPPNICRYLKALDAWLRTQFIPDYTALRIAVCNVEKQAFSNSGVNAKPPKFCTGGPVVEPPPPPPPPVF